MPRRFSSNTIGAHLRIKPARRVEVPIKLLVPGDVIVLSAGDMIPADCRVLRAQDLFMNQAAMTGESLPVEKFAQQRNRDTTQSAGAGQHPVHGHQRGVRLGHRRRGDHRQPHLFRRAGPAGDDHRSGADPVPGRRQPGRAGC